MALALLATGSAQASAVTVGSVFPPGATPTAFGQVQTFFNAASAVKFGATPASGFTVESETQITAIAPPSTEVGAVDVTVTTLAGTSATGHTSRFLYEGCVVPKLKKKTVKAAKRALRRSDCKLGKVIRRKKNSRHVVKQSPKPRTVLAPGSKVNVTDSLGAASQPAPESSSQVPRRRQ